MSFDKKDLELMTLGHRLATQATDLPTFYVKLAHDRTLLGLRSLITATIPLLSPMMPFNPTDLSRVVEPPFHVNVQDTNLAFMNLNKMNLIVTPNLQTTTTKIMKMMKFM